MPFLWLISQDVNDDYDTYDSAVVCAATAAAARLIHPSGPSYRWTGQVWRWNNDDYDDRSWAEPENVKAEQVGIPSTGIIEGAVICASFNAG